MECLAKTANNATVKEINSTPCWTRLKPEPLSSIYQWKVQTMELQSIQISVFLKKKKRHLILVRAEQLFFKKTLFTREESYFLPRKKSSCQRLVFTQPFTASLPVPNYAGCRPHQLLPNVVTSLRQLNQDQQNHFRWSNQRVMATSQPFQCIHLQL